MLNDGFMRNKFEVRNHRAVGRIENPQTNSRAWTAQHLLTMVADLSSATAARSGVECTNLEKESILDRGVCALDIQPR